MTRVLLIIIGVLFLALVSSGIYLRHEMNKLDGLNVKYNDSQAALTKLNQQLLQRAKIETMTDAVVGVVQQQNKDIDQKIDTIKEKVVTTSKQEDKGEITSTAAANVYLDSMWRAYCQTGISNPHCSSR